MVNRNDCRVALMSFLHAVANTLRDLIALMADVSAACCCSAVARAVCLAIVGATTAVAKSAAALPTQFSAGWYPSSSS
jgi:hypothetical protein